MQSGAAYQIPLFALAIQAVDIEYRGLAKQAGDPRDRAIGHVTDQNDVHVRKRYMNHRQQGMEGGVEVLPGNGGQNDPADAGGYNVVRRGKRPAAVHRNFVPPRRQASGELLGKRFKATIACGNTPGPQDSDFNLRVLEATRTFKSLLGVPPCIM